MVEARTCVRACACACVRVRVSCLLAHTCILRVLNQRIRIIEGIIYCTTEAEGENDELREASFVHHPTTINQPNQPNQTKPPTSPRNH